MSKHSVTKASYKSTHLVGAWNLTWSWSTSGAFASGGFVYPVAISYPEDYVGILITIGPLMFGIVRVPHIPDGDD